MATNGAGNDWQTAYIIELVEMLERIATVIDGYPEVWRAMEQAGVVIPVRTGP